MGLRGSAAYLDDAGLCSRCGSQQFRSDYGSATRFTAVKNSRALNYVKERSPLERIVHFMKRIILPGTVLLAAALLVVGNTPGAFAKPQKAAGPGQENADPLVNTAMKNMESG